VLAVADVLVEEVDAGHIDLGVELGAAAVAPDLDLSAAFMPV
jgi:hypothetical protein